jgi:hypothetical protein
METLYKASNPDIEYNIIRTLQKLFKDPHKKLQAQKIQRIMWIPPMHPKYKNPSQEDPSLSKKSKTQSVSQRGEGTNYVSRSISVNKRHT